MVTDIRQLIDQRLAELPVDVRQAIQSADVEQHITDIGETNHLHIDQIGALQDETLLVMLGFSDPAEFPDQLQKRLSIPAEQAAIIAANVSDEIFETIRESMRKFMEEQARKEEGTSAPIPAPSTPAPARTIMPEPLSGAPGNMLRPATPSRPSITSITRAAPAAPATTPRPPQPAPQMPVPQKPPQVVPLSPVTMKSAPPPPNLPGTTSASQPITYNKQPLTTAPAPQPVDPLRRINEKLSAPSLSAAKTFDLSLGSQTPRPPAPSPTTPEPPVKKPYTKDPYREPVE